MNISNKSYSGVMKYLSKRLIIVLIVGLAVALVFSIAFNNSRINTYVKDAMTIRAETILSNEDHEILENFFSTSSMQNDEYLHDQRYTMYDVTTYDYDFEVESTIVGWVFPTKATVRATEIVEDITGQYSGALEEQGDLSETPPTWYNTRYEIKMEKDNGRWYIVSVEAEEI